MLSRNIASLDAFRLTTTLLSLKKASHAGTQSWVAMFCVAALTVLSLVPSALGQPFSYTTIETDVPPVSYSSLSLGDFDEDGDLDVVLSGNTNIEFPYLPKVLVSRGVSESVLFGEWTRTFETVTLDADLWMGTAALLDFNRDNKLDLFVSGSSSLNLPFEPGAALYLGDGAGGFSATTIAIESLYGGSAAWGDYDNDGDDDLLLTGTDASNLYRTLLYRNNEGSLEEVPTSLPGVSYGDAQWGDIDNDGDKDLLLVGSTTSGDFVSDIYQNDNGTFNAMNIGLLNPVFASVDLGDFDSDGDLDIAIGGGLVSENLFDGIVRIARNDGGTFVDVAEFEGGFYGEVRWGDHDTDGDLDLMTIGTLGGVGRGVTRIYQNRGADGFEHQINLPGLAYASAKFGDYDSDGDLDVFMSGQDREQHPVTKLYRNDQLIVNTRPSAPSVLASTPVDGAVFLTWQPGVDELTEGTGLSYSVRVGTGPGLSDIKTPGADPITGNRRVPMRGNADVSTTTKLTLPPGTYYWSVQSVDNAFLGSEFAAEQSFTVVSQAVSTGLEEDDVFRSTLLDPFPNPVHDGLSIPYELSTGDTGILEIYSSLGQRINRFNASIAEGTQLVSWNGEDMSGNLVASGIYFVRLQTQTVSVTRTVVVVR